MFPGHPYLPLLFSVPLRFCSRTGKGSRLNPNPPGDNVFALPAPPHPHRISELTGETACSVFVLNAILTRPGPVEGPLRHTLIRDMISAGVRSENGLRDWITEAAGRQVNTRDWDHCRREADELHAQGIHIYGFRADFQRNSGEPACPSVLFGRGEPVRELPWLAVFNSRKPRLIAPASAWLEALRFAFSGLREERFILAASFGTTTYDLALVHALRVGIPSVLISPHPLLPPIPGSLPLPGDSVTGFPVLSCLLEANGCPGKRRLVCRDRILAAVSHVHLVLELRSGGNLISILERRQRKEPGLQFILEPERKNRANAGNSLLLDKHPAHARRFRPVDFPILADDESAFVNEGKHPGSERDAVEWHRFLFHYTRGCPGPWPGESYPDYLGKLLDGNPLSGHSALDTLIRMASEKRIRGGCRLVRGREPVVSLSALPSTDFGSLRKWNTSLARWTVEPYGVAISRDYLRSLGAKPVVYGLDDIYHKLRDTEKYRFQHSGQGRAAWKFEHEWRLRGDLDLNGLQGGECFLFVPTGQERRRLIARAGAGLPVVALDALHP